jgi:hypothetical protein
LALPDVRISQEVLAMKVHQFKQFEFLDPDDPVPTEFANEMDRAYELWNEIIAELMETDLEFRALLGTMTMRCDGFETH